jgi:GNAT superfamily N-acetyltransferase
MPAHRVAYETKELSPVTWPDFEKLFSQGNGWDHCFCIHFQRPCGLPKNEWLHTRAERAKRNRRQKKALVDQSSAHGILVYADEGPVGWCQYGLAEELPRIDGSRNYHNLALPAASHKLWRITCFVVDRRYRRRGIATLALKAALESIKKQGGGVVEGYPVLDWKQLRPLEIRRRGRAPSFGNVSMHGTVSMFAKQGFKRIAPFGPINVVMRRTA